MTFLEILVTLIFIVIYAGIAFGQILLGIWLWADRHKKVLAILVWATVLPGMALSLWIGSHIELIQ